MIRQISKYNKTISNYYFSSQKSSLNDLSISNINLDNLNQTLIDQFKNNQSEKMNDIFQRNLNLANKLQKSDNIDQVKLSSELLKYNTFIFQEYIRNFYRVRIWNKSMYDSHFISIQQIAARILFENFLLQSKNQEIQINKENLDKISSEYIEQDIYQLFGIKKTYKENKDQLIERYQVIQDFKNIYGQKIQFQDFVKYIEILNYSEKKPKLIAKSKLIHALEKTSPIFNGLVFLSTSIEFILLILCIMILTASYVNSLRDKAGIDTCYMCMFRLSYYNGKIDDFNFCTKCNEKILLKKKEEENKKTGIFTKFWRGLKRE